MVVLRRAATIFSSSTTSASNLTDLVLAVSITTSILVYMTTTSNSKALTPADKATA